MLFVLNYEKNTALGTCLLIATQLDIRVHKDGLRLLLLLFDLSFIILDVLVTLGAVSYLRLLAIAIFIRQLHDDGLVRFND